MAKVLIYCTMTCPYCTMAKRLLDTKGVAYESVDVSDAAKWKEMAEKTGGNTVPQIVIGDHCIGGCDDLYELENTQKLNQLLEA